MIEKSCTKEKDPNSGRNLTTLTYIMEKGDSLKIEADEFEGGSVRVTLQKVGKDIEVEVKEFGPVQPQIPVEPITQLPAGVSGFSF